MGVVVGMPVAARMRVAGGVGLPVGASAGDRFGVLVGGDGVADAPRLADAAVGSPGGAAPDVGGTAPDGGGAALGTGVT